MTGQTDKTDKHTRQADGQTEQVDRQTRQAEGQTRQTGGHADEQGKQMERSDRKVVNKTDRHDMDQRIRQTGWTGKTGG